MTGGTKVKRPAFQFYPSDWRKDEPLQDCSIAARGLWHEMLCIMHECQPYGHFALHDEAFPDIKAAKRCGVTLGEYKRLLAELEAARVFSRTANGTIYSRRMVKDERVRNVRAAGGVLGAEHGILGKEFGVLGGNPQLKAGYNEPGKLYAIQRTSGGPIKVGITKHPAQRFAAYRKKIGEFAVLGVWDVADMGGAEAKAHAAFEGRINGEWIDAEWSQVATTVEGIVAALNKNTTGPSDPPLHPPFEPPPSSSSSSSASPEVATASTVGRPVDKPQHPGAKPQNGKPFAPRPNWWKTNEGIRATADALGIGEGPPGSGWKELKQLCFAKLAEHERQHKHRKASH
jgi:hypothetical protein